MSKARRKRRRKGYAPRPIHQETQEHLRAFLDTLTPEEQAAFRACLLQGSPKERLEHLRENPPSDEILAKLTVFLQGRELSGACRKYYGIGPLEADYGTERSVY